MELLSVKHCAEMSRKILPSNAYDFYRNGAGNEFTMQLNSTAFQKYRIRPRYLKDVSNRSTRCKILGADLKIPIGISPTAMHKLAHSDGELATSKAAGDIGTIYIMSVISNTTIADIANAAPDTIKWCQLYIYKNRQITKDLIRNAEFYGFKAIVLTIDAPVLGRRKTDVRSKFRLPPNLELVNFTKYSSDKNVIEYSLDQFDETISWDDVKWLISSTKLPVVLKGILTKEDALMAAEIGVNGIIVSNHGGRQLDGIPASIEALPEIVENVGHKLIVMLDGGIYEGIDVFKALALGAKFIFVGRPIIWGLAVNGQEGVKQILQILTSELDNTMALAGTKTLDDINSNYVVSSKYYRSKI